MSAEKIRSKIDEIKQCVEYWDTGEVSALEWVLKELVEPSSSGNTCIDCGRDITNEVKVGAGSGTGQRFRCKPCHIKKEDERK